MLKYAISGRKQMILFDIYVIKIARNQLFSILFLAIFSDETEESTSAE
jgi:hypothetical protein